MITFNVNSVCGNIPVRAVNIGNGVLRADIVLGDSRLICYNLYLPELMRQISVFILSKAVRNV